MLRHRNGAVQEMLYVTQGCDDECDSSAEDSPSSSTRIPLTRPPRTRAWSDSYHSQARQVSPSQSPDLSRRRKFERKSSDKMKYRPVTPVPMEIHSEKSKRPFVHFVTAIVVLMTAITFLRTSYMQRNINNVINHSGSQVHILQSSIAAMNEDLEQNRRRMKELQILNDDLIRHNEGLSHTSRSLDSELQRRKAEFIFRENEAYQSKLPSMRKKETILSKKVNALVDKIQRDSYRDAYERFGPGPHRVQFTVELPGFSKYHTFVVELAPLSKMPHSVHLFLDQVYHDLWDDCSFVFNAPHVIQAGAFPISKSGKSYEDKMDEFDEMGLSTVHFQEYNEEYPHKQWTVGFADTGPDFYINMQDNSEKHGPRSKGDELFDETVDPCFGEIIQGRKTIEMIYSLPADRDFVLENPVHIVEARIMDIETDRRGAEFAPHDMKNKHFVAGR